MGYRTQTRAFRFQWEGKDGMMEIPVYAKLTLRDGTKKEAWQMEEGEEGQGQIELHQTKEVVEVWFTCIEP